MQFVVIGFGSQAKAWSLNLRDSGHEVIVALRANSQSAETVKALDFKAIDLTSDDVANYNNFLMLTPDNTHKDILDSLSANLSDGSKIFYAHGYSYKAFNLKESYPKLSHLLLAPKAIASEVRFQFETKGKLGAGYSLEGALERKDCLETLSTLSEGIGITAGPYELSFVDEAYADLFSEQTLLCSLLPYGALECFNRLRSKGIRKEIAYLESWLEVKLIADAMVKMGPEAFFQLISPNALIGSEKARQLLFDKGYQKKLDSLLEDIWSDKFVSECQNTDFTKIRKDVLEFWKEEELSKVHSELGADLVN